MDVLATPITEAVKCSIPFLGRQIGYLVHFKRNLQSLINQVNDLGALRNDVDRLVQIAREKGDLIKQVVEAWLAKVDTFPDEVTRLNDKVQEIDSCLKGWCCTRYHLGKESKMKIDKLKELLDEGRSFSSSSAVSDPAPLPSIEALPKGDFQDFASRKSTTKQILRALNNDKICVVGVYGMGGVGKTTLMKEIGKKVERDHLFSKVVMATVSQNPDLNKLQDEIAEKLGMKKLEAETVSGRAGRLSKRLKDEKCVLVILDDLWERLDLTSVGIPLGDDHKGCKVVLTTRSQDICNEMETQEKIEVGVLSEQDSWNFFRQKAGDVVDSPSLQALAREVANECGRLPLALVTIGRALRDKDKDVWEDAVRQLKKSIFEGMSPVLASIKLSYNYLGNKEIKRCFLLCSFFPEDWNVKEEDLMWHVIGEELFRNVDTLEEARGRLHTLVDKLIASSLLLKGSEDRSVKMHDIVRDAALSILTEESNGFIVKAGLGLTRWPDRENLRTCKQMSLVKNSITEFPEKPECPELLNISFSWNTSLMEFPDSFFERMTSLVTLNLGYTGICSLPSSLSCLVNLRTLILNSTNLSDISVVGNLKKLEILSLSETRIEKLPVEMGGLTNLKMLDLSHNIFLRTIPQNLLSRFSLLEELNAQNSFFHWGIEGMENRVNARLTELASLNCLTNLNINISDVKFLSEEISTSWKTLIKWSLNVGGHFIWPLFYQYPRSMALCNTLGPLPNWIRELLKRTDALALWRCKGLINNVIKLDVDGFVNSKYLCLDSCDEIENLHSVLEEETTTTSTRLRQLNSRDVSSSSSQPLIFTNLTCLHIWRCSSMKHLFPMQIVRGLPQLQKLDVFNCRAMEEIIVDEEKDIGAGEQDKIVLPQLRTLKLRVLPKLSTFYQKKTLFDWPSLEVLGVTKCPNLKKLPLGAQSAVRLKKIFVDDVEWFKSLEWEDPNVKSRLQSLMVS